MSPTEPTNIQPITPLQKGLSCQAGYLPVPLRAVPPESLAGLAVYILHDQEYTLYRNVELNFGANDCRRLIESGMDFVFVSVKDHQRYYRTMEKCLVAMAADRRIQTKKKAEMLYSTSIELAQELLRKPPDKEQIDRTQTVSLATVKMIIGDKFAFDHLFEISNHDFFTATHAVNVCTTTVALAGRMGLTDPTLLQNLGSGALLHDVGKIFIDSELLNTDRKITPEEYEMLKKHVDLGREHLERVAVLPDEILQVVSEHHERIDGSGYPRGLKGDDISLMGRLAGIVDTFDAMTSARPYRNYTFSVDDVLDHLEKESGKFDAAIVRTFNRMIERTLKKHADSDTNAMASGKAAGNVETHDETPDDFTGDRRFRIPMWISRIGRKNSQPVLEEPQRMIVHNMTRSGLSFLSPRPVERDQPICISLTTTRQDRPYTLLAVTADCHDYGDGWYSVTARFHQSQPPETIEKIKALIRGGKQVKTV